MNSGKKAPIAPTREELRALLEVTLSSRDREAYVMRMIGVAHALCVVQYPREVCPCTFGNGARRFTAMSGHISIAVRRWLILAVRHSCILCIDERPDSPTLLLGRITSMVVANVGWRHLSATERDF
jgi:hypothetical protein